MKNNIVNPWVFAYGMSANFGNGETVMIAGPEDLMALAEEPDSSIEPMQKAISIYNKTRLVAIGHGFKTNSKDPYDTTWSNTSLSFYDKCVPLIANVDGTYYYSHRAQTIQCAYDYANANSGSWSAVISSFIMGSSYTYLTNPDLILDFGAPIPTTMITGNLWANTSGGTNDTMTIEYKENEGDEWSPLLVLVHNDSRRAGYNNRGLYEIDETVIRYLRVTTSDLNGLKYVNGFMLCNKDKPVLLDETMAHMNCISRSDVRVAFSVPATTDLSEKNKALVQPAVLGDYGAWFNPYFAGREIPYEDD